MARIASCCRVVLLVSLLVLLAACGSGPAVTSVALPPGWQTVKQAGFSFALPPAWEVLSAEDGNFESALDDAVRENPRLERVAGQARTALVNRQIKLLAFDLAPEDELPNYTTMLSIGQQPLEQPVSLAEVTEANERQLQASGFSDVNRAIARIAGEDVARLSSTLQINDASGAPLALAVEQFIVLKAQQQYILTFTTVADQRARMQPVFEQIMATLRIEE